jgi:hypothetical protein
MRPTSWPALLAAAALVGCGPAPEPKQAVAIDANQAIAAAAPSPAEPAPAPADELADTAEVVSVEAGTYPMYALGLKLFSEPRPTLTLNADAEALGLGAQGIEALRGRTVAVRYTIRLEPDLRDLQLKGVSLLGADAPRSLAGLARIDGLLSGAETESGDLPSKITNTPARGAPVSFDYFVTAKETAANGQPVTGYYGQRPANRILSLSPAS